jgi:hypothetical protein
MERREETNRMEAVMNRNVMRADHIKVFLSVSSPSSGRNILSSDWINFSKKQPRRVETQRGC